MDEIPGILACDVGNSAVHLAAVCGDEVSAPRILNTGQLSGLGEAMVAIWEHLPTPRSVVACSVSPASLKAVEATALDALSTEVLVVGRDLPLPIETRLTTPASAGTDRLCAAVAAYDRLGHACVVADFGSAITVDCVDDDGVFLGGAIMPGLRMSLKALHDSTAQLPHVELAEPNWTFGRDTRQAILGGVVYAARGALRALVESYATALGRWPVVIATGGDAPLICHDANHNELIQAIVPDLTLRGAAIAYYRTLLR